MSSLKKLQAASSLAEVADALGYTASSLAYIVFKLPDKSKYKTFDIPKKTGGVRTIDAPIAQLKSLQRRLANLLYQCQDEIKKTDPTRKSLSHGFKKSHSIITNATPHKNRRFVLNLDIEGFFPSLNFGRVRGFFLKSSAFKLKEDTATIIAQIACYKNSLPQGSPCSPIISDMIAHLLDLRMVRLAKANRCTYTRYADDLTFSTNQKVFPKQLAHRDESIPGSEWLLGSALIDEIAKAGFTVNAKKTRMQLSTSRQLVTGLTVNKKVNVRADYYRKARAMCNSLFGKGSFTLGPGTTATVQKLVGIVNHAYHVKNVADRRTSAEKKKAASSIRKLYHRLLFYRNFAIPDQPLILCEGKTDSIYLKLALIKLPTFHAKLTKTTPKPLTSAVRYFNYGALAHDVLQLGGGTGDLKFFISRYKASMERFKAAPQLHPVIVLTDNDSGTSPVFGVLKEQFGQTLTLKSDEPFYHLTHNLYLIKTPALGATGESCIESLFDNSLLTTVIDGKKFNPKKEHDAPGEYGKLVFAEKVVRPQAATIDFSKFSLIFARIVAVLNHYKPPPLTSPVPPS